MDRVISHQAPTPALPRNTGRGGKYLMTANDAGEELPAFEIERLMAEGTQRVFTGGAAMAGQEGLPAPGEF
jgi:hypothetical protein